jgi:predicted dehydrogenase
MKMGVGVIGCGSISGIYLQNLRRFEHLAVMACADLIPERAAARAAEHGVPWACSVEAPLGPRARVLFIRGPREPGL